MSSDGSNMREGGASDCMFSQEKSIVNPFPLVCHRLYIKLGLGVKPDEKYTSNNPSHQLLCLRSVEPKLPCRFIIFVYFCIFATWCNIFSYNILMY